MSHRNRSARRLAILVAAYSLGLASIAFGHGTMVDSRVYRVRQAGENANLMGAWTSAMYDWAADSNTFPSYADAGFSYANVVPDGLIASAGHDNGYAKLNTPGAWPTTPATAGQALQQKFVSSAIHNPSFFDLWITKPGFDVTTQTLGWGNLEKLGRWQSGTQLSGVPQITMGTAPDPLGATLPSYDWNVNIPADRSGRAALVCVWQRIDSAGEAFFSVQDLMIAPGGSTWNLTGGGSFAASSSWSGGVVPNTAGAIANFGDKITTAATVSLATDTTLGTLRFNNANAYTLGGNGMVMMETVSGDASVEVQQGNHVINTGFMLHSSTTATVAANASLTLNGAVMFSSGNIFTKNGAGTLRVNASNVMGAPSATIVNAGGTLQLDKSLSPTIGVFTTGGAETHFGSGMEVSSLTLSNTGTKVTIDSASAAPLVVKTTTLGVGSGTVLDLGDNALVLNYSGTSLLPVLKAGVVAGLNNTTTAGRILSTAAQANAHMSIGVVEASSIGSPTSFLGTAVDSTSVLARYTFKGDADLSGTVNFADLVSLAQHYNTSGSWREGDSDYSGTVNFADLVALAQNYNGSLAAGSVEAIGGASFAADWALARSLVPEPTMLGSVGLAALMLVRRRRA